MDFLSREVWITAAIALGAALLVIVTTRVVVRLLGRRWTPANRLERRARLPFRVVVLMIALNPVVDRMRPGDDLPGWDAAALIARILLIVAVGWLLTAIAVFGVDMALMRNAVVVAQSDNRAARRVRTQVLIMRRVIWAVGVVITIGAVLLTFPGVESFGASVLASAGVISVIAGLAATSVLSNVFAGLQLAFSDAIRIDDAVIVENEWGRIEEITLTYVVVQLWDDRRLVLPSTYFTTNPFQNWTRESSELLGAVELDLDWRADTGGMRRELDRILDQTELWDGRVKVLQVTDATNGFVRVRVLVSAADAPMLFDLRCLIREDLVAWVREHADRGMPRQRTELVEAPTSRIAPKRGTESAGLFHGDEAADERAARLTREIDLSEIREQDTRS